MKHPGSGLVAAGTVPAPSLSDAQREVIALEGSRIEAMLSVDVDNLERLLHPRLSYMHSSGDRDTKASLIEKVARGYYDYTRIDHWEELLIVEERVAVVVGRMDATLCVGERVVEINSATTCTWLLTASDGWQLLAFQSTSIASS